MRRLVLTAIVFFSALTAHAQSAPQPAAQPASRPAATSPAASTPVPRVNHPALLSLKWQLLAGTDTFGDMTAFEMIDLLHGMTIHHLELAAQPLSPEHRDVIVGPDMSDAMLAALLAKLKSHHMDVVSWVDTSTDHRQQFSFAHRLGAKNLILTEQPSADLDKLANEFRINAVYDFTMTQQGLDARQLLAAFAGFSARSGLLFCVDDAQHYADAAPHDQPNDAAAVIRALSGRLIEVRFRDGNVPLGTGRVDLTQVCQQLRRQRFVGQTEVQYFPGAPDSSLHDRLVGFVQSVNAFSDAVSKVAGIPQK